MNNLKLFFRQSKLTLKLTKSIILKSIIIFGLIIVFISVIVGPILYNDAIKRRNDAANLVCEEFNLLQSDLFNKLNFLAYMDTTEEYLKNYEEKPSSETKALIEQYLQSYSASDTNLLLISIYTDQDIFLNSFKYRSSSLNENIQADPLFENLKASEHGSYISLIDSHSIKYDSTDSYIPVVSVAKKYNFNAHEYIFILNYDISNYLRQCRYFCTQNLNAYAIFDEQRDIFYSPDETLKINNLTDMKQKIEGIKNMVYSDNGILFQYTTNVFNWTIIGFAKYSVILQNLYTLIVLMIISFSVSLLLFTILLVPTNIKYLSPLKQLSDTMSNFSIGQTELSLIQTKDEIEDLNNAFISMAQKISSQMNDLLLQEKETGLYRYKLLITQIDPHFIYNTMGIINLLARQRKTKNIIDVNNALIHILRDRLSSKSTIFETIEKEINTLKQYVKIMDFRYKNSVTIFYDIDPAVLDYQIPKNIIQPLVENAFFHGLTTEDDVISGEIGIIIYPSNDNIIVEVSDDGMGIEPDKLANLNNFNYNTNVNEKIHIGLENIQQRLFYIYESSDIMLIRSHYGHGTTVILTLPSKPSGIKFM